MKFFKYMDIGVKHDLEGPPTHLYKPKIALILDLPYG